MCSKILKMELTLLCLALGLLSTSAWSEPGNFVRLDQAIHSRVAENKPQYMQAGVNQELALSVNSDGSYEVSVAGHLWLRSAPSFVKVNKKVWSTEDGSLSLQWTGKDHGTDRIGDWSSLMLGYSADGKTIVLSFRTYEGIPAIVFGQDFVHGANGTTTDDKDNILSGFPGFKIDGSLVELGYLAYGYLMVGNMDRRLGRWDASSFVIRDGLNGGPMALFDKQDRAVFVSPFDQFMSASVWHDKLHARYYWGIMGGVQQIPKAFSYHTVMFYSDSGINSALSGWGDVMRLYYNKRDYYRESDFTNNYLSYWSDNGAYYVNYYVKNKLIQNMTYEEAMLGVSEYANAMQIPYRSLQYSVWFKQGKYGGNGLWEADTGLFPDGMKSPDTPYAKKNGGDYDFFVEELRSLPYEDRFWTDMFRKSQQWGVMTYMQDWLNDQFSNMNATTCNTEVARTWLMQMGMGAQRNGITIQYCMSQCRHILQSLEIPVVTQARASNDYQPDDAKQWRIGMSSMLAWAVGLAPYKDTLWTTSDQPGNYYHKSEPFPAMQLVISTLSMGPVGPGDMINGTNIHLLMKCCAADGLILKPSKPAMSVDDQMLQQAFGGSLGPAGEVWTTFSDIGDMRFGIIFAANLSNSYSLRPSRGNFGKIFSKQTNQIYGVTQQGGVLGPRGFTEEVPLFLTPKCTQGNFCLYYTSPLLYVGERQLVLLGELSKWVPISPRRILSITFPSNDLVVTLQGVPGEEVDFYSYEEGAKKVITCVMAASGQAKISYATSQCSNV